MELTYEKQDDGIAVDIKSYSYTCSTVTTVGNPPESTDLIMLRPGEKASMTLSAGTKIIILLYVLHDDGTRPTVFLPVDRVCYEEITIS
jgi:hypothetical protein